MIEVIRAGTMTTVQDWPGRVGLWDVGVPPSGPMDDRSFRLGNGVLGNPQGAPGLECTLVGPKLRMVAPVRFCVTGADCAVTLDDEPVEHYVAIEAHAGAVLDAGKADGRGLRVYVLFAGGVTCEQYLGSAATFTLGRFGGKDGRALQKGDVLELGPRPTGAAAEAVVDPPELTHDWVVDVTEGPHAAPEFFTRADVDELYATAWEVHFNSARTGVRLVGPRPHWAREDGGEAGLHPSNIHDTTYSVGSVDYTGDTPVLLGPDGPSLGGFVCPMAPAFHDRVAADVARLLTGGIARTVFGPPSERLLVVGAHRAGQPLNGQLAALGARRLAILRTAPDYRLYRLGTDPSKPALVRVGDGGASIEGELWELPVAGLGAFVAALPAPMALGRVRLEDGSETTGFLCEALAVQDVEDITAHGSWLDYLAA